MEPGGFAPRWASEKKYAGRDCMCENVKIYLLGVKLFLCILTVLLFSACAPALYHRDFSGEGSERDAESISFSAKENGETAEFPKSLSDFYGEAVREAIPEGCRLGLSFEGRVEERFASPWYLGVLVLAPLWPAMPRESDLEISISSELLCEGIVVEKAQFFEEEHPHLFWYGLYRKGYVQDRADMIHTKLAARLRQSLLKNVPADNTLRSDF